MSTPSMWKRLQQARLFRVVLVYLAAAWLALEIAGELSDTLSLPAWVSPVVFLILLAGLVVVAATAWVQSMPRPERDAGTEPGPWGIGLRDLGRSLSRGRMPHLTWGRAVAGGITAFLLLTVVVGGYVALGPRGPSLSNADEGAAPTLAVLPFRTSGPGLEVYREGMVDLLSTSLDGVGGLRTIASRTVLARWKGGVGERADLVDLPTALGVAHDAGGRWALLGSVVALGPEIRLGAELYDAATGAALGEPVAVQGHPDSVLALADRLSVEVARRLLIAAASGESDSGGGFGPELASVTTRSPVALRAFLEGSAAMRRSAFPDAIRAFERAVAEDSSFALAFMQLGHAHGWAEAGGSEGIRYHREAARHVDRLPPREALLVRAALGVAEGDLVVLSELRQAVRTWPDDPAMWYVLGEYLFHMGTQVLEDRSEASRAFARTIALDPDYTPAYIHAVQDALVEGRRDEAERLLEAYGRLAGADDRWTRRFELARRLGFGDETTRAQALAALDTIDLSVANSALNYLPWPTGLELAERAETRLLKRPDSGSGQVWRRIRVLFERGRYATALEEMDPVALETPRAAIYLFLMAWSGYEPAGEALRQLPLERLRFGEVSHLFVAAHAADRGRWDEVAAGIEAQRRYAQESRAAEDTVPAAFHHASAAALEGYGLLRRGEPHEAIALLEATQREYRGRSQPHIHLNAFARLWLAEALEAAGRERDALRYWESATTSFRIPVTHFRRAQLHARLGETERALRQYAVFLEAWKDADPELQQVRLARDAVAALEAER